MDRDWMFISDRFCQAYVDGVNSFIEFAKARSGEAMEIKCPCTKCRNYYKNRYDIVKSHLLVRGMMVSYTTWLLHGEHPQTDDQDNSEDEDGDQHGDDEYEQLIEDHYKGMYVGNDTIEKEDVRDFEKLLEAAQRILYPGCKETLLSYVIEMLQLKVENGWSNNSFNKFLSKQRKFLPEGHVVPNSIHECKKLLRDLGLGYELIDACPKDCVLFWKENAHLDKCPKCKSSRFKVNDGKGKKIPHKILRYLPLTCRLQRLYMNSDIAKDMRWHNEKRVDDEQMRHPADAPQWKEFDRIYPEFSRETRNVRLGLATDGLIGSTSIPSKKRVRGPTRGVNVDRIRKNLGQPIPVEIDREAMAIVGHYATSVAYAIGDSIRAHAPVRDIGWGEIEFGIRESILLRVGQTFGLGDYKNDMVLRRILDVKCQSLYAEWKCRLYKQYRKIKKKVADPKNHPVYPCNPNDWVFMIENVWHTKAWKKKSKRGKNARKGLKYNHTSGSQSFVARASKFLTTEKRDQSFAERFKETHIRHRLGEEVWIHEKAKQHHDEIVKRIEEQSQPDVTNPLSEQQISVDVLGKRSGYLKGYGIRKSNYSTQSQGAPNPDVEALKQQVADYAKKFDDLMLMLTNGINPAIIPGLIQRSENMEENLSGRTN